MVKEVTGQVGAEVQDKWLLDQAWLGLMRSAEHGVNDSEAATYPDPSVEFDRLGLSGFGTLTPFDAFSTTYLAAYRGSRRAHVLTERDLLKAVQRLEPGIAAADIAATLSKVDIEVSALRSSPRAILSSWNPFALTGTLLDAPVKQVTWFSLQWAQAILLDVGKTMEILNTAGGHRFLLKVVDAQGKGVPDAKVTLVFDQKKQAGIEKLTDLKGVVSLLTPAGKTRIDAIAVVPRHSHWNFAQVNWAVPTVDATITLRPLKNQHVGQFKYLGPADPAAGGGVRCGVIDSGIGPHPALMVAGGGNFLGDGEEDSQDIDSYEDNGTGHGTHVAGIIAAKDLGNGDPYGIAPGAQLFSYRVVAKLAREAASYAIEDAIDAAVKQDCHLINVSLGLTSQDDDVDNAVQRAYQAGCVVIAAVGNDPVSGVMFPASSKHVVAVAALGDRARTAADTMSALSFRQPPSGTHPDDFVANFNSKGPEVKVAAPGVGIISCAPGGPYYAAEDGTSMAAPVITGFAAKVLALRPDILTMKGTARADAILNLIFSACDPLGFARSDVGNGHPKP